MKETRLINRFSEKSLIWGNGSFLVQKLRILITLDPLEEFFKILHNEKGQEVDESNNGLSKKNFVQDKLGKLFRAWKWHILMALDWFQEFF